MWQEEERPVYKLLISLVTSLQFLWHDLQFAMGWIFIKDGIFQTYLMWLISYVMAPVLLSLPASSSWWTQETSCWSTTKSAAGRGFISDRVMVLPKNRSSSHEVIHEKIILPRTGTVEASRKKFRSTPKPVSSVL